MLNITTKKLSILMLSSFVLTGALTANATSSAPNAGDFMIRMRAIGVMPQVSSSITTVGGKVHANDQFVPELDFTYFATKNIAMELIAATTKHDLKAKGTSLGTVDVGSVKLLPPTLNLQYHFTDLGRFKPYIGAGINYTVFYDGKPGALASVKYENRFGYSFQAGADYHLVDNWYLNVDAKKLYLQTKAKFNDGAIVAKVKLDPWILGVGFGYKF